MFLSMRRKILYKQEKNLSMMGETDETNYWTRNSLRITGKPGEVIGCFTRVTLPFHFSRPIFTKRLFNRIDAKYSYSSHHNTIFLQWCSICEILLWNTCRMKNCWIFYFANIFILTGTKFFDTNCGTTYFDYVREFMLFNEIFLERM